MAHEASPVIKMRFPARSLQTWGERVTGGAAVTSLLLLDALSVTRVHSNRNSPFSLYWNVSQGATDSRSAVHMSED